MSNMLAVSSRFSGEFSKREKGLWNVQEEYGQRLE